MPVSRTGIRGRLCVPAKRGHVSNMERLAVIALVFVAERLQGAMHVSVERKRRHLYQAYPNNARGGRVLVEDDKADAVDHLAFVEGLLASAAEDCDQPLTRCIPIRLAST